MLYKFKSKASADVIMLQPNGQRLLEIIGKHAANQGNNQGILLPEQMSQALAALQTAIVQEQAQRDLALAQAQAENLPLPRFDAISLRQRAGPLMDMIRVCQSADEPIVWGV